MTSIIIKTTIITFFLMAIRPINAFTQKQYYAGTQQMTSCPCEAAQFFKGNPYEGVMRPNGISPDCRMHTAVTDTVPEGFYLMSLRDSFGKKSKKKPKPAYPKTSSIIRF